MKKIFFLSAIFAVISTVIFAQGGIPQDTNYPQQGVYQSSSEPVSVYVPNDKEGVTISQNSSGDYNTASQNTTINLTLPKPQIIYKKIYEVKPAPRTPCHCDCLPVENHCNQNPGLHGPIDIPNNDGDTNSVVIPPNSGGDSTKLVPVGHDYSNWLVLLFALLFVALLMLFDFWLKNRKKTDTKSITEAMTPRYTAINTQAMLDKIIANGGSIDHTITRDSETLSVKVNPPVVLKKVPTKVAEVKKEEVKKGDEKTQ